MRDHGIQPVDGVCPKAQPMFKLVVVVVVIVAIVAAVAVAVVAVVVVACLTHSCQVELTVRKI